MSRSSNSTQQKTRQPDHEGTPERIKSGKIRYTGYVTGQRICGAAKQTAKEAKADYKLKVQQFLNPRHIERSSEITFEDFAYDVIDGPFRQRKNLEQMSPKTWDLYEQIYRINIKGSDLGQKPLSKVVPADIERWVGRLLTQERIIKKGEEVIPPMPMRASSKTRYLGMVQSVLEYAVKNERLIAENPAVDVPRPQEGESTSRALTDKEVAELIKLCDHEPPRNGGTWRNRRRLLIVLLGLHGFGPSEICGLKYSDFDGSGFTPRRQGQRFAKVGIVHRTRLKTRARSARVPARSSIIKLLESNDKGWIVCTESGGPMEPGNLRKVFKRMVRNSQFSDVTPYDLRHTFANELLRNGVDVKTAADLMRHSVETFLRRYVHGNDALKVDAINKLSF